MKRSKILRYALIVMNKLFPKKDLILFNSFPAYSDNSLALFEYIIENRKDITQKYEIIWGQEVKDEIPGHLVKYNIKRVNKKSIKGIWTFLRAKYIFSTHGYFPDAKSGNGQMQINLWHGCGYKTMPVQDRCYIGDRLVVTSELFRGIESKNFGMSIDTILPLGYPRNDWLFNKGKLSNIIPDYNDYQKILIWLPTYRKSEKGHIGTDGNEKSFVVGNLSHKEFNKLDAFLSEKKYLMIIKPHPMDAQKMQSCSGLTNIQVINNCDLASHGITLYEIMSDTDALISDYSSVVVDYLLLNKPIIMALSDMKEYKEKRGFDFDPLEDYFPGPIVSDMEGLIERISELDVIDTSWANKRKELLHLFQNHIDNNSSKRICEYFFGTVN